MPADPLRTKLKALVEEWRKQPLFGVDPDARAYMEQKELCADELADLLAEGEPEYAGLPNQINPCGNRHVLPQEDCPDCEAKAKPLGHEYVEAEHSESCCIAPRKCHAVVGMKLCGQPRSAHELDKGEGGTP